MTLGISGIRYNLVRNILINSGDLMTSRTFSTAFLRKNVFVRYQIFSRKTNRVLIANRLKTTTTCAVDLHVFVFFVISLFKELYKNTALLPFWSVFCSSVWCPLTWPSSSFSLNTASTSGLPSAKLTGDLPSRLLQRKMSTRFN